MKCFFKAIMLSTILVTLSGCITYEQIKQPPSGSDLGKIARFEYMQSNWSYFYCRWIKSQRVTPEELAHGYGVPYDQAKDEVAEFVNSQYNYNWFHCFLLSIYLDETRFYID